MKRPHRLCLFVLLSLVTTLVAASDDIVVADFEGKSYGDWRADGEAFGPGPAQGTLSGQMEVTGYAGKGLVNSFYKGDSTTGTLTSPEVKLQRKYVAFLIGGGGYEGKTCLNLLVDGNVVRTATGPNTQSGGSERLERQAWDVSDLLGKTARFQIVDRATGGWGHVNVDQIVLTDTKPKISVRRPLQTREILLDKKYLLLPIRNGAKMARVDVQVDGQNVREFDAEIAVNESDVSFWAFLDTAPFAGKSATLRVQGATEEGFALIATADEIPGADKFYGEALRPQFHFSQQVGWNNDPNGMVYHDGRWHLFFQHNPYGWKWGNMHWGHAVSKDLVHWEQRPIAIYNKRRGDWAFSGGAVVDEHNTAGWQTGDRKVIVAAWTSTSRGECLSYSTDGGRTFTEYDGNPVIEHRGRDPKIVWYEPGKHWVLAVYDETPEAGRSIAFYTSKDLKEWKLQSRLPGYFECPELFELPVDGERSKSRWVVFAADARYAIGQFDGKKFTPEHEGKLTLHYGDYYASQTFSNAPDGRRIQIGWARIAMPGMPFNQTFSFPHELTLRTTDEGVRMFAEPVREIEKLYTDPSEHAEPRELPAGASVAMPLAGELYDVQATFALGEAKTVGLDIGGQRIAYDVAAGKLAGADLKPVDGRITIRVLIDRPMLEIIGNHGRVVITRPRKNPGKVTNIAAFAEGGTARLQRYEAIPLRSIWKH